MVSKRRGAHAAAVDLFCGAGGLSYGMMRAGIRICAGVDLDPMCRHPFEHNVGSPFYEKDVRGITPDFVRSRFPKGAVRILAGCAPCQPFSCYSRSKPGDKWSLLSKFADLVSDIRPEVVTMENVPGLLKQPVFERYVKALESSGYDYRYEVVNCADYGVPQTRRRLVLLASRLGRMRMIQKTHTPDRHVTVRDVIRHLKRIPAGGAHRRDRLHRTSELTAVNLKRIRNSRPNGTWRDWRPGLRSGCHRRESGMTYSAVYGRMSWDMPGPTITTQFNGFGNGRFGHPVQDRAISLREGALLQTFPEDYSFVPDGDEVYISRTARLIGNAVPVLLGEAIGKCIIAHLGDHNGR